MPLFYFRPFHFHPDKHPKLIDIPGSDIALMIVTALFGLGLFVAFVVIPTVIYLNESLPGG